MAISRLKGDGVTCAAADPAVSASAAAATAVPTAVGEVVAGEGADAFDGAAAFESAETETPCIASSDGVDEDFDPDEDDEMDTDVY